MSFYDENKTLEFCPYNPAHVVRRAKMPMHIQKCERNAPVKLPRCSFNSAHILPPEMMESHESECPDRLIYDRFLSNDRENSIAARVAARSKQVADAMPEVAEEDCWDNARHFVDRPVLSVVREAAQERDVFLNFPSAAPTERKLHVTRERERRAEIKKMSSTN